MKTDFFPAGAAVRAALADEALVAVVFDMDGLLLDTERLAREAHQHVGRRLGVAITDSVSLQMIGLPADLCHQLLRDHFGETVPVAQLFAEAARDLEARIDAGLLQLKPGALALLDSLEAAGLPRALATSSARAKTLHHLKAAGLAERFDAIVTRDDVAHGKPHPDLFLEAARRLGVAPRHCLALEDSHNGVRAAHAAGMRVIMVPDLLPPTEEMRQKCRAVLGSLAEVGALIGLTAADSEPGQGLVGRLGGR